MTTILTASEYTTIEAHVTEHAPNAYELTKVTAHLDAELHTVWLDPNTSTVWHAWNDQDDDNWNLDTEGAVQAQEWIAEQLVHVLDRLADPDNVDNYQYGNITVEDDLDTLAELEAVQLAALRTNTENPVVVDRMICHRMDLLRSEISRLSRLRAVNLQEQYGSERGAPAAAARALDISHESARRALNAASEYAQRARSGAEKAKELLG